MIKNIFISLLKTTTVGLTLSLASFYVFNTNILDGFILCVITQFVIFYLWNSYLEYRLRLNEQQQATQQAELFSSIGVNVKCAYCNAENYIPIRFDDSNDFECESCGKPNSTYVDVTVAQQTEMLSRDSLSINSYIKDKIDATESIRSTE